MSFREHPLLLRQSFVKLWPNNIFFYEEKATSTSFLSLYQTQLLLEIVLHYRYTKIVTSRSEANEIDVDQYINLYKYQKNERRKKLRLSRGRSSWVRLGSKKVLDERIPLRKRNQRFTLLQRFIKGQVYQQVLQPLMELGAPLWSLLPRIREPLRRLRFWKTKQMKRFSRFAGPAQREKHFLNSVCQVILLHYYKSTPLFAAHFGRELEKVHKKVHWRLIYSIRSLLNNVPSQPAIRRQLHGLLIEMHGRPKGRARTFVFRLREGSLAPQSYFFRISFGMGEALAKVGALGIRIWIVY